MGAARSGGRSSDQELEWATERNGVCYSAPLHPSESFL